MITYTQASNPNRDNRFAVVSAVGAANVNREQIQGAGDDASDVVIVPLIKDGRFNSDLEHLTNIRNVNGEPVVIYDYRADHKELLLKLYNFWKEFGEPNKLNLSQTLKKMSGIMPAHYFAAEAHEEGIDVYPWLNIATGEVSEQKPADKAIMYTPNIDFTYKHMTDILRPGFRENSQRTSRELLADLVSADILPYFPQAATTYDAIVIRKNNILVHKLGNGQLSLPGGFYSPEKAQAGADAPSATKEMLQHKYGINAHIKAYLGTVGGTDALGHQADDRYPRLSKVFVTTYTGDVPSHPKNLPAGAELIEIPLFKVPGDPASGPSDEVLLGLNGQGWAYFHNQEILPLFYRALELYKSGNENTAEDVFFTHSPF